MKVDWTTFKAFITDRSLSAQYVELPSHYWLKAFDGSFALECGLDKNPSDTTDLDDWNDNYKASGNKSLIQSQMAFASKVLPDGKKLYKRMVGMSQALSAGSNNVIHTVTFAHVKMVGVEIIGAELGDYCDFMVLDDTSGTYSTIPNYQLNQFGWSVQMAAGKHEEKSNYDADLYVGMQIKLVYNSASAKTVGFNFDLNEVKA